MTFLLTSTISILWSGLAWSSPTTTGKEEWPDRRTRSWLSFSSLSLSLSSSIHFSFRERLSHTLVCVFIFAKEKVRLWSTLLYYTYRESMTISWLSWETLRKGCVLLNFITFRETIPVFRFTDCYVHWAWTAVLTCFVQVSACGSCLQRGFIRLSSLKMVLFPNDLASVTKFF